MNEVSCLIFLSVHFFNFSSLCFWQFPYLFICIILILFRMGLFPGTSRMGRGQKGSPSLKSVTHFLQWWNLTQLYLTQRRTKNCMNYVTKSLSSADISTFSSEICKFCYIEKYKYRLHFNTQLLILLTFLESLKTVSIKMVMILMMSAKMATLDLLIKKVFWKKGYDDFAIWRHQQNFLRWLKFYRRCGYATKMW